MSRSLNSSALSAVYAQQTGLVPLTLLTIDHDDLSSPLRLVNNNTDIVSNSRTFTAYPFEIAMPQESEDESVEVQVQIDNVDRTVSETIRSLSSVLSVDLEVIFSDDPDDILIGPLNFSMRHVTIDAHRITARLVYEPTFYESWPSGDFNPSDFPGIFQV